MEDKANYFAVIPANVRYDKEVTANAKLLYGEIAALSNKEGYCWASNEYFADLYEVTTKSISDWIGQLAKKGHIKIELISNGREGRRLLLGTTKISSRYQEEKVIGISTYNNTYTPSRADARGSSRKGNIPLTSDDIQGTAMEVVPTDEDGIPLHKERPKASDAFKSLLKWSEDRRGFKFMSAVKQYTAFAKARSAGLTPGDLKERWQEMEGDDYWASKGFDWMNVVASLDKKR